MLDATAIIGTHNVLLITLDSLRYDVAQQAYSDGRTPNLAALLPQGWEKRHTHATFTYPAHHAIFAGFLPARPERGERLLACHAFTGTTIGDRTYVFDSDNIVTGLADLGYHTACIGGVGFFNKMNPLGMTLPKLFDESHWRPEYGIKDLKSAEHQIRCAHTIIDRHARKRRTFLFMNMSATHTPHAGYLPGATHDSCDSQAAALANADTHLGSLFLSLPATGPWLVILCADHGDAYGDDGCHGHGIAHNTVWTVPYGETVVT